MLDDIVNTFDAENSDSISRGIYEGTSTSEFSP
jgi:hypothetical protein